MLWGCSQDNKIVRLSLITKLTGIGMIEFTISLCHFQDQLQIICVCGAFLWCKLNQVDVVFFWRSTAFAAALEMKHA